MPIYDVTIRAEHILLNWNGQTKECGFITTRRVQAVDEKQAEINAIEMIRIDEIILNALHDPPIFTAIDCYELNDIATLDDGMAWFEIKPKRWWQFWRR